MIGYRMVTSGYTNPHLYLEFIYIDKAYRARYKILVKNVLLTFVKDLVLEKLRYKEHEEQND